MDCDKFESVLMDELYGELDELTSAAVKRHMAACGRCAALFDGLRATRRVALVPAASPSFDLEARILAAAYSTPVPMPLERRAARAISVAGSWAMRPQTAMAAVFLVMIGTSGLLLRGKSSRAPASAAMTVTEEGTPAPAAPALEPHAFQPPAPAASAPPSNLGATPAIGPSAAGGFALAPNSFAQPDWSEAKRIRPAAKSVAGAQGRALPAPPPPTESRTDDDVSTARGGASARTEADEPTARGAAGPPADVTATEPSPAAPFDSALAAYRASRFTEAGRAFDALSAGDVNADLWAARSLRDGSGCRAAVARFDEVAERAPSSSPGWDAALEGARCYRLLGDVASARARLTPLLKVPTFADRARVELSGLPSKRPLSP
jgi:hypothetical protein